jgi:hypothetical protein
MNQPYSAWADWLDKFHTASELIQALWLLSMPLTVLGVTYLVARLLKEALIARRHRQPCGRLLCGVYEDRQGRLLVYRETEGATTLGPSRPNPPTSSPDLFRGSMS